MNMPKPTLLLLLLGSALILSCNKESSHLIADFSVEGGFCEAPCTVSFTNLSQNAVRYQWDFGDGTGSDQASPAHTFQFPGIYTVTLTVFDKQDREEETSRAVTISGAAGEFYTGMDLSYQTLLEDFNVKYYNDAGEPVPSLLEFVRNNGVNLIRVRLFHTPSGSDAGVQSCDFPRVLELCKKVKATGNKLLLDLHYSDSWADPGNQSVPAAWAGLSFEVLKDSVYQYTKWVLERLDANNALPDMVQIGNETNSGFLWNYGRVWNEFDNNWGNYAQLINSAVQAVKEMEEPISTIIHVAGPVGRQAFFDKLLAQNAEFDIIGLSYYSYFHTQNLDLVQSEMNQLAAKYGKPILIAETNYPWTLEWDDWTNNIVGLPEHLTPGFPATPEGQKAYTGKIVEMLKNIPDGKGIGFVWWAPDMVAFNGPQSSEGSAFENLATFDFTHKALPVFEVFRNY